jgi:hypothetical protein
MSFVEKRRYERVLVDIYVHWGWTPECIYTDKIISISVGGCFLRTSQSGARGQSLFIRLWLAEETTLACEVRYHLEKMGMGLEFTHVSDEQTRMLDNLLEHYRRQTQTETSPASS